MQERVSDAQDRWCGTGLAQWFKAELAEIPVGGTLRSIVRDPSASEELPALARLMGQRVISVEQVADHLEITVERIK